MRDLLPYMDSYYIIESTTTMTGQLESNVIVVFCEVRGKQLLVTETHSRSDLNDRHENNSS